MTDFNPRTQVIERLEACGATFRNTLLHVGAGTFVPVDGAVADHVMHHEPFSIATSLVRSTLNPNPATPTLNGV